MTGRRTAPVPATGREVVLVLGGARSGKSALAERLVGDHCTYVATYVGDGPADGDDMPGRLAAHRARRPATWPTVETRDPAAALRARPEGAVLLDSLGTWVAGRVDFVVDVDDLVDALRSRRGPTVVVSEEVGLGVHPSSEAGRRFRDALGEVNHRVADAADRVLLVVAGRALELA